MKEVLEGRIGLGPAPSASASATRICNVHKIYI